MQFRRANRLLSEFTTYHGDCLMSVLANIWSFALEYSTQRVLDSRSIGDSFHRL